ncbi:PilZ domain-containing protein [Paenibacillus sambharensis]|uniref:PilZ domain-containing protein n=1 Tax=Paenibacillus sambharensis TaxID=1803190 RepID=A0A2W1LNA1_9BACL|nr:PilZ domain-containing protein [Paenibacillus sambharensis]PZD96412.1 PilZ domain-containing protein [Paenibacillus sambharensis]
MSMSVPITNSLPYYGSKEGSDITVMLNCKAVVEKKNFIATGVLTYAAGEIIEIELPQFGVFELGESVRIMVYTGAGIYVFQSRVLAKAESALVIINPPENRRRFLDKRQEPRVPVQASAQVLSIYEGPRKTERVLPEPLQVQLDNISLTGTGFVVDMELPLQINTFVKLDIDLGFSLSCRAEIVRKAKESAGLVYGLRFEELSAEHTGKLRAFLLKSQIETYYEEKRRRLLEEATRGPGSSSSIANLVDSGSYFTR